MLIIVTTHPIQYQVPLWQALARDGRVPFQVWYMTHHAVAESHDTEFRRAFAWDIDMLGGYSHRLMKTPPAATPTTFHACRFAEPLAPLLQEAGARAVWIQGWQVMAYWQAAFTAKVVGAELWLRAESNNLAPGAKWKVPAKRLLLGAMFSRVDRFFCIGSANRQLYRDYGVPESRLSSGPYAIDNERFAAQASALRPMRSAIRERWGISVNAFCLLFCGKFIPKKNPVDLLEAARIAGTFVPHLHVLFVGSGELGETLRTLSDVAYDADANTVPPLSREGLPKASFAGFLNQTSISEAYVAADCLVLPSDYGETWGLVVNEAMASGLPCIISDRCGSAQDLGSVGNNAVFPYGDIARLMHEIVRMANQNDRSLLPIEEMAGYSFGRTVQTVVEAYNG